MPKIITAADAAKMIKEHDRVIFGGFLAVGSADNIIDQIVKLGTKNLHGVVICTDYPDRGMGKLVTSKQFKSLQTSHIGTNKETQAQFNAGTLKIEFNPQGTLAERIRAGGAGLGGFLTPTGVGTILEKEKEKITVDGKEYFLERPIRGDYSLIRAKKADKMGNLVYDKTGRNSNPVVAMASNVTIVEVDELVEVGELRSEEIVTPGMFIDYIVIHKD